MQAKGMIFLAACLLLLTCGCSVPLFHPTPVLVTFDDVCEHGYVSLTGRLQVGSLQTKTDVYYLYLMEAVQPGGEGRSLSVAIRVGSLPNSIEPLPSMFDDRDVRIHTDDHQIIGNGQIVVLTGSVMADSRGQPPCRLYEVDRIQLP